ncbi:MAG: hypothetical protein P0Y65_11745 [Candidatus Devosia phytovorans]|uniref:Uncharacterized protein n=1 Tax=Candidatus Devosia phytovorans TaxID=3121372 RepID=A0AAJ5VST5_9HYPH|nr:hypothetical protein [Devosia sp.]WEK02883.1 MAG: hypothetical protein P0Y65_11745 [Devosia sp.]
MSSNDRDATFAAVRAAMMASYAGTLASTRLSPLEALECLSAAIGSIYREIADSHLDPDGCGCGWLPNEVLDIATLEQAISAHAGREEDDSCFDLRSMRPVGNG